MSFNVNHYCCSFDKQKHMFLSSSNIDSNILRMLLCLQDWHRRKRQCQFVLDKTILYVPVARLTMTSCSNLKTSLIIENFMGWSPTSVKCIRHIFWENPWFPRKMRIFQENSMNQEKTAWIPKKKTCFAYLPPPQLASILLL